MRFKENSAMINKDISKILNNHLAKIVEATTNILFY